MNIISGLVNLNWDNGGRWRLEAFYDPLQRLIALIDKSDSVSNATDGIKASLDIPNGFQAKIPVDSNLETFEREKVFHKML